jgi:hypothetical protein
MPAKTFSDKIKLCDHLVAWEFDFHPNVMSHVSRYVMHVSFGASVRDLAIRTNVPSEQIREHLADIERNREAIPRVEWGLKRIEAAIQVLQGLDHRAGEVTL